MKAFNTMQQKVVQEASKSLDSTKKALIYMATGTGKTETAIKLLQKRGYEKVLWLTHQDELAKQSFERFNKLGVFDTSIYSGQIKDSSGAVVVATIQTISKIKHLSRFSKSQFDAIVVDECHHAPAATWEKTIKHFECDRIGLTATPFRPDNKYEKIFDVFGQPVGNISFDLAVKNKFLAKPVSSLILTDSVIKGFTNVNKELTSFQLDKLYSSMERNKIIVKAYQEEGRNVLLAKKIKPKAVVFCINVAHARLMADLFQTNGLSAAFVCGDSAQQSAFERELIMTKFRTSDKIELICAVNIFNEGVDIPEANICMMLRPTGSNIIYQQQVGRVARNNGGKKKFFIVLDFVDNCTKGFSTYMSTNLTKGGSQGVKVVFKYLRDPDSIAVKKRVEDLMLKVREFEASMWRSVEVNKQNAKDHLDALKEGKVLVFKKRMT